MASGQRNRLTARETAGVDQSINVKCRGDRGFIGVATFASASSARRKDQR